ncbi:hypothetical protein ASE63_23640 [Bosea sp. Root381]|uniref:BatD family protein n=1 Tax=Bosea sp. Root381 TaxID=1736524 RepID=UPI0007007DCA|nr:BatD family protein [Bosea sp. Root381]KRE06703.1 hypothetical protein ASE63_23640 [Bosea sp. Root381]
MRILLALLLLLVPLPAVSQAPGATPLVRTSLKPSEGVVIGQPVTVSVAVLFPGEMQHPPLVKMPEAAGAQIMRFESQGTTVRDTIDGQDYVGQTFEFVLFPRRGGTIEIPPPAVILLDRGGDPAGSAKGTGTRLDVTVPKGVDPSAPVLVADRVNVEQNWLPDPATARFKAGDAIVRTIQRRADGVPALGMAEFRFTAPDGVRVYAGPPVVDDRPTRMGIDGHRTEKVTYVFERPGSYELPALTQPWLTSTDKDAHVEALPGTTVTVEAAPEEQRPTQGSKLWALFVAVGAAIGGGWFGLRRWRCWQIRWHASPEFQRRTLIRVARSGDARSTYEALAPWRECLTSAAGQTLEGSPALWAAIDRLECFLFRPGGTWTKDDGHVLAVELSSMTARAHKTSPEGSLPRLNPESAGRGPNS